MKIEPALDVSKIIVEHYLKMLPLAALIYQRGYLALHAAAVSNSKRTLLLAGDSGCGKSTLVLALLQRGWRVLADDLAIIDVNEQGHPVVYPTDARVVLRPELFNNYEIKSTLLQQVDQNRFELKLPEQNGVKQPLLSGVYILNVFNNSMLESKLLKGNACFKSVGKLLFNSHVADVLCSRINYLRCAAAISNAVPIIELNRPRGVWSVEQIADHIENNPEFF